MGLFDISSTDTAPVVPQMPDQAPIGIAAKAVDTAAQTATDAIAGLNAPANVSGDHAQFGDMTSTLNEMISARKAELSAGVDALKANSQVNSVAQSQISKLTDSTIDAYGKLQKAAGLPGGADGDVAQLFSIFNSDYNADFQKASIQQNILRASQIKDSAAALVEQNNAVPTLMGKVSQATTDLYNAQKDANTLFIEGGKLADAQMNTKINAARLNLEMTKEQREATTFKINSMSMGEIQQQLTLANQGKGQFKNLGGLLEERLMQEQSAMTSLDNGQLALKKGNREEYNASQVDFVSHLPVDAATTALQNAQKSGAPVVSFGKDHNGNPIDIPISLVQQGILQAGKMQEDANKYLAADYTQRLNIIPNATNLMNVGQAFSKVDPRAGQIFHQTAAIMQQLDIKDPNNVRQTGLLLEQAKTTMDSIIKDNADKMSSPEGKAALINAGKNGGHFDAVGGAAAVADTTSIPALANNGLHKDAWSFIAQQVATESKKQNIGPSALVTGGDPSSAADQQAMYAQMLASQSGKEKLKDITQRVLADPSTQNAVRDKIKATIQTKSIFDTFQGLGAQKGADPIWNDIFQHNEQVLGADGALSLKKMANLFEMKTVLSGGKTDYAKSFLAAYRNYGANAETNAGSDPSYTWQDHALEGAIFGDSSPYPAVVNAMHYNFRLAAQAAHAEMQARIQSDISGKTVNDAIMRADPLFEEQPGLRVSNPADRQKIQKHTGVDPLNVPSATGTGMTVEQIKRLYGGGQ